MEDPRSHEYWGGTKNKYIRYWFYMNRGMDWVNQFRNLVICIAAIYMALKLQNPLWLLAMMMISMLTLTLVGYIQVHHLSKVLDWLNVRFSTHYSLYSIKLQEDIRKAVRKTAGMEEGGV